MGVSALCPGPVDTRIALAERNRPGREREALRPLTAPRGMAGEAIDAADVMDPADVAAQVVEAVRDERFYVLTHGDKYDDAIRERMEAILERRNPDGDVS